MPKLYSSAYILKVLGDHGFIFISQKGSHVKLRKIDTITLTVIVPANRKEIPIGTFRSILRQSMLTEGDFK
jgi:predicted RNA binding protein YcfA (HicA-like mRNA interferase family)